MGRLLPSCRETRALLKTDLSADFGHRPTTRVRRTSVASSAPTASAATAASSSSGHQPWTVRQAQPAAYGNRARRLGGSHQNDPTSESTSVHSPDADGAGTSLA